MVVFLASAASAADVGTGANLLGMGGVGAAASHDNAAITLNPGLLALEDRYDFQGQFAYGPDAGLHWGFSAADARGGDHKLAGGFSYTGDVYAPPLTVDDLPGWVIEGEEIPNRRRQHEFALGLAIPFAGRRVAVGLSGNLGLFDFDRGGNGAAFDLDAEVGWRPVQPLTLGLSARNVVPWFPQDRATSVVVGARAEAANNVAAELNAEWSFDADPSAPATPLVIAGGLEKVVGAGRIRVGASSTGWPPSPPASGGSRRARPSSTGSRCRSPARSRSTARSTRSRSGSRPRLRSRSRDRPGRGGTMAPPDVTAVLAALVESDAVDPSIRRLAGLMRVQHLAADDPHGALAARR
ncbi:MAG: hypothetical protein ABMB14_32065 [Myxococcota bacterium]